MQHSRPLSQQAIQHRIESHYLSDRKVDMELFIRPASFPSSPGLFCRLYYIVTLHVGETISPPFPGPPPACFYSRDGSRLWWFIFLPGVLDKTPSRPPVPVQIQALRDGEMSKYLTATISASYLHCGLEIEQRSRYCGRGIKNGSFFHRWSDWALLPLLAAVKLVLVFTFSNRWRPCAVLGLVVRLLQSRRFITVMS